MSVDSPTTTTTTAAQLEYFKSKQRARWTMRRFLSTDMTEGLAPEDAAIVVALRDVRRIRESLTSTAKKIAECAENAAEAVTRGFMVDRLGILGGNSALLECSGGAYNVAARIVTLMLSARDGYAPELLTPEEAATVEIGKSLRVWTGDELSRFPHHTLIQGRAVLTDTDHPNATSMYLSEDEAWREAHERFRTKIQRYRNGGNHGAGAASQSGEGGAGRAGRDQ